MTGRRLKLAAVFTAATVPAIGGCTPQCPPTALKVWDGGFDTAETEGLRRPDGRLTQAGCNLVCASGPSNIYPCEVDAGVVICGDECIGGRVPPGGAWLSRLDATAGSWLARMAELEGAAVVAFEQLAAELTAHGLPKFAEAALVAAIDEVRHATELTRLALGFGVSPTHRRHALSPLRTLEEVAIDNGGEGCGRELFGTLVNLHQAQAAADPRVRATMARVAVDEASHARISFELAEALMPRLTVAQRRRVREAQEKTVGAMVREELPNAAARQLGLMGERALKATAARVLTGARV